MKITFTKNYNWAILPKKKKYHISEYDHRDLYDSNFRWVRKTRQKELCMPWRIGNELGWYILSPIDILMSPVDDVEIHLDEKELEDTQKFLGFKNLWKRDDSYISVSNDWMKLYQYRGVNGNWEAMFIPNGEGSIEWRLGFSIKIPKGYSLLLCPIEGAEKYEIPFGLLPEKYVNEMSSGDGISIAITPKVKFQLSRGEPFARIILIENETINAECENIENV